MKNLFLLTVLVVTASALPSDLPTFMSKTYLGGRIVGGRATPIEEAPYQVSIRVFGGFHCGGSIISNEWILTAAHCAYYDSYFYEVSTGSDTAYGGDAYKVSEIYIHKNYSVSAKGVPKHDIALMRLEKPIEINERQKPVTLFEKDEEAQVGTYAMISGYGRTETGLLSTSLRSVIVPVISKEECFDAYIPYYGGIGENQICASYPNGGKDACAGDSGGPMTIDGRLAGIVSWGRGCAVAGNPGVYTEVSKYRDWIAKTSGLDL